MTQQWDEFSKSLADKIPRRESLRLFGAALAGAMLGPLGLKAAGAAGPDPCKAFCRCASKRDQQFCLAACRACNSDTSRLCGSCGSHVCTDFANDDFNCGGCGNACDDARPYEYGACLSGACIYDCIEGAVDCNGTCTALLTDPQHCGACGNVCGESTPYCEQGGCTENAPCPGLQTRCRGACRDLNNDPTACGTTCENAVVCGIYETCTGGACVPVD